MNLLKVSWIEILWLFFWKFSSFFIFIGVSDYKIHLQQYLVSRFPKNLKMMLFLWNNFKKSIKFLKKLFLMFVIIFFNSKVSVYLLLSYTNLFRYVLCMTLCWHLLTPKLKLYLKKKEKLKSNLPSSFNLKVQN